MATITAADVNKLRQTTGAGMMDCKKALVEAEGDFDKAIQNLREKGQKVADNRSDRESSEGAAVSFINADNTKGAIITLNCETDFVGKNESFINLAKELVEKAINFSSKEEFLASDFNGMTVAEKDGKIVVLRSWIVDCPFSTTWYNSSTPFLYLSMAL